MRKEVEVREKVAVRMGTMGRMGRMDIMAGWPLLMFLFDKGSVKPDNTFCFPLGLTHIVLNRFSLIKSKDS